MKRTSIRYLYFSFLVFAVSGCSSVSNWWLEDDEREIRVLQPINAKFDIEKSWETSVGSGVKYYFSRLRPVSNGKTLFVADRQGLVVAMDAKTGKKAWQRDFATYTNEGYFSGISKLWSDGQTARIASLAEKNGQLYVASENGTLRVLSSETGEDIWQASVAGEILAPATIDEGFVVINTGGGTLYAFDERTGEQKWLAESDVPPLSLRGISAPLASNGGVITGTPNGYLRVKVLDSGVTAWETAVAKPSGATELERIVDIDSTPLLYGGTVFTISYNGTLAALELRTGRIIWKREYGAYRNLSMSGNELFVVDIDSNVYALDRRNGVEKWTQGGIKGRQLTSAVPFGRHVVVGDNFGYLHWINRGTGEIDARYELGADSEDQSVFADPLVVDDTLIAVTRDGRVSALKPLNAN